MNTSDFQQRLISNIEKRLNISALNIEVPPQGMSSKVFFIKASNGSEYAVKYGKDAGNDVPALKLISNMKIEIPIPRLYDHFEFEGTGVIILERIKFPLLETLSPSEMPRYIPSMVENLRKLHSIKSATHRVLSAPQNESTWKEFLLSIFNGKKFNWEEISSREGLDKDLVLSSVAKITNKIEQTEFSDTVYSLLHTDFNQRNLFIDPKSNKITGIIDWEDAMFGDPIYDFARIRMLIWHFDFGEETVQKYYDLMNYTPEQRKLEDLYWLSRVTQYLAWYSEELNEFNLGRIKLHQDYLKIYDWEK